ncbi:hypothetical protein OIU74_026694 [Salix koriyanagi]|uniref:Uncharacterized protein n=1 Tax=Salix koriyanagi TaxID=2511006 RepID=A0A9Q0VYT9_9ROSI|nr:hypothetical protein OIU74_026694 [Salix koriyanagi]
MCLRMKLSTFFCHPLLSQPRTHYPPVSFSLYETETCRQFLRLPINNVKLHPEKEKSHHHINHKLVTFCFEKENPEVMATKQKLIVEVVDARNLFTERWPWKLESIRCDRFLWAKKEDAISYS